MNTEKIAELTKICKHPQHDPPKYRVFEPGIWKHTCPVCGHEQIFKVIKPIYGEVFVENWSNNHKQWI